VEINVMDKDFFFHLSLVGIGFIVFQILGFGIAIPEYRLGFILLSLVGGVIIWLVGYINKCGMAARNGGYIESSQITIAYAPSIMFGSLAVIALMVGFYVGH